MTTGPAWGPLGRQANMSASPTVPHLLNGSFALSTHNAFHVRFFCATLPAAERDSTTDDAVRGRGGRST